MSSNSPWNSLSVITTVIALLAMIFGALQWHTADQQRLDAKQVQKQLDQEKTEAERRYVRLANDHRADLERRELIFSTTLKEWEVQHASLSRRLAEKDKIIELLNQQLVQQKKLTEPQPIYLQNESVSQTETKTSIPATSDPIVGHWIATGMLKIHNIFYQDGSMEQSGGDSGIFVKGTYKITGPGRMTIVLNDLFGKRTFNCFYSIEKNTLRMRPDQFLSIEMEYCRSQ